LFGKRLEKNNAISATPCYYWACGFSVIILYGHSAAHYLKHLKFDLKDIQIWLRHNDIQTTANIYLNMGLEAKTDIAEKLNEKFTKFAI